MKKAGPTDLERGRIAHAARAWDDAYTVLSRADGASPLSIPDLERLAWSANLTGRVEEFLKLLERVYHTLLDRGDEIAAAHAAFWIGFRLFGLREPARASGWLARAQRLVDGCGEDCAVMGYLCLPVVQRCLATGKWQAAADAAARAAEIGDRFRDRDLTALARSLEGRACMRLGRMKDGLALVDEAMVAVTSGELSPAVTGLTYCIAIAACSSVYALDRAREWTSALAEWCDGQPQLAAFTGACQIHRAEIKQLSGAWPEAIAEARKVSARPTAGADFMVGGDAFYQEAEIHRLQGEGAQAEEGYRRANEAGREPQPGLSLLRLGQGRRSVAASGIRRALGTTKDGLARARMLPAAIEIFLAAGEAEEAKAAGQELEAIAEAFGTEPMMALAAQSQGAIFLADGKVAAALGPLRRAFATWQDVGAPYAAARVRVLLARACRELGDREGADLETAAARAVFEQLGARPDLEHIDGGKAPGGPRPHRLTGRELEVLRLVASGKTNKSIAQELFLSEKTVDRHVSNIFGKVHVSTRSAATAFAYENKLI